MSTTALKSSIGWLPAGEFIPAKEVLEKKSSAATERFDDSFKLPQLLRSEEKPGGFSSRDYAILGALVVVAHVVGVEGYLHSLSEPTLVRHDKTEVVVELVKPVVIPQQKIEPPKPLPPEPKVHRDMPPPPRPTPSLRTAPAERDIAPDALTVPENTQAPHLSEPVAAAPAPPAPSVAAPKEEPVIEASAYASYLHNPSPEYPAFAQRQGWEGKVVLRVRVLASGHADDVQLKQSSGRKSLDEAAIEAVKGWTFAPSKRGGTPVDGWATVPIEFKLAK